MEFAAGAMNPLLRKLGELLVDEYNLEKRVKKGVRSLRTELAVMHVTLVKVGEVPPDQLDMEVRIWAGKVRELFYDMEDAIDGFMVRVEEGDHDGKPTNVKNRVKKFLKKTTKLFTKGKTLHQISDAIQEAQDQAKELAEQHNRYKIEQYSTSDGVNIDPRLIGMYKDVKELVGIEEPRDKLIQKLTEGDEESKLQLKTISIVGFGGLGKTTLAKAVYDKMKVQFNCGAFVSVSRTPDMKKVLKDVMYELHKGKFGNIHSTVRDEKLLIDELCEFLENKRYLIIIDDIWDEKSWEAIKCALPENNLGRRLITTTRNVNVAKACGSSSDDIIHTMRPLSDKDSKRLFYRRIFHSEMVCPDELQEVSREILKKCDGVPLAIISIASSLVSNESVKTKDQWYILLKSIGRGLAEGARVEDMQKIISFSYYDMPPHMKTCLLYLSMFPENYEIERKRLIWMWIAEGLIHCGKQNTCLFDVGESYFNELVNRSMIIPVHIGFEEKARACRVHDMVRDLLCSLSSEENFVTILDDVGRSMHDSQSKVRRLSLQGFGMAELSTSWLDAKSMSQVRSISLFLSPINLMPSLAWFEVLRVLDLEGCNFDGKGDKIDLRYLGNLLYMRYLGLRRTFIGHLPSEIGKLQFLQTLDIRGTRIRELPSSVVGLRQLMYLCVDRITKVPVRLGNLMALEELRMVDVDHFSQDDFEELSNLTELRVLKISFSSKGLNESKGKALAESIGNMHRLKSLELYGSVDDGCLNFMPGGWVPPPQLRIFNTEWTWFSMLPKWINPSSLPLLSDLQISVDEVRWEDIQILGTLLALRYLFLWVYGSMEKRRVERGFMVTADAFPCLRECTFDGLMTVLPSMFPPGAMPMLRSLCFPLEVQDMAIGGLDPGMAHLPSLERVEVRLRGWHRATAQQAEAAKAAVRQAADAHPNRPTLEIYEELSIGGADGGIISLGRRLKGETLDPPPQHFPPLPRLAAT